MGEKIDENLYFGARLEFALNVVVTSGEIRRSPAQNGKPDIG